jgi:uncharacterized protein YlbG (UPF0298 family)
VYYQDTVVNYALKALFLLFKAVSMKRTLLLLLFGYAAWGQTNNKPSIQQNIWRTIVENIIKKNTDSLIKYVAFPLEGDWAAMADIKTPINKCTQADFVKSFDKIFIKELITDFEKKSFKDVTEYKTQNEKMEFSIGAGYSKNVDGFTYEGGLILHIKKINGIYKLYSIQGVGGR